MALGYIQTVVVNGISEASNSSSEFVWVGHIMMRGGSVFFWPCEERPRTQSRGICHFWDDEKIPLLHAYDSICHHVFLISWFIFCCAGSSASCHHSVSLFVSWGLLNLIHLVQTFWLCCFCSKFVIQFLMFHAQRKIILLAEMLAKEILTEADEKKTRPTAYTSHRIHVWYICLHLP